MDRLSVAAFVRIAAVSVRMVNICVLMVVTMWFAATGAEELEGLNVYHLLVGLCIAAIAGLLTAEMVLRLARSALLRGFFLCYAIAALGVCLGGVLTILLPALFLAVATVVFDSLQEAGGFLLEAASLSLLVAVLSLIEGLILAFPLAALLGRFQSRA